MPTLPNQYPETSDTPLTVLDTVVKELKSINLELADIVKQVKQRVNNIHWGTPTPDCPTEQEKILNSFSDVVFYEIKKLEDTKKEVSQILSELKQII